MMTHPFKYPPATLPHTVSGAIITILCLAAFTSCTRDVAVISSDGTEQLGRCNVQVTTCIDKFCPQGAKPLRGSVQTSTDGDLLIRCLHGDKPSPDTDGGLW